MENYALHWYCLAGVLVCGLVMGAEAAGAFRFLADRLPCRPAVARAGRRLSLVVSALTLGAVALSVTGVGSAVVAPAVSDTVRLAVAICADRDYPGGRFTDVHPEYAEFVMNAAYAVCDGASE